LEKENWDSFIKYKKQADIVIGNHQMIALCNYSLDRHSIAEIINLSVNHQFTLVKSEGKWEHIESSKRKKAEETAVRVTKDWEHTFDAVPDLIAIIDTNYKVVRANRAMGAKLGMTPEECIGLTCFSVVHGTTKPPSFCPHRQLLKDEFEHTAEVCEDCLGGYFIVSVSPLYDSEGKLIGSIHVARDINERRQIEEALRKSEEKYRNLIETANEGIWILDTESRTTYVNTKMAEMIGYSRLVMIDKSVRDFTDDEGKSIFELNKKKRKQVINESHEFKLIRKNGLPLWALVNSKSLFDNCGTFIGSMHMLTDITERKEAEAKLKEILDNLGNLVNERTAELESAYRSLKESEASLAEAQRMTHIGNWDWDLVTNKLHWSDELYRIFGRNPQESGATYNEFLNCLHPEDQDYVENAIKKGLEGEPIDIDHRIILANGEERTVHVQAEVIFDEKNRPIRAKGVIQDTTELKKSEEKIRNLANIVESSNDAIGTISLEGTFTSWNKSAEEVYGYSAEEILGRPLSFVTPSHLGDETNKLSELVKQGEMVYQYETLQLRKDKQEINVSITLSPVFDVHGKLTAISFVSRNITERKRAEEALANIEIARKKEIHHIIKNNLQVISSLLDLQADKFNNRECIKYSEVLEAFRESQDRVISMALIHEELYKGGGLEKLNFSPYIEELAENLFHTYNFGNTDINLKLNLEKNVFFDMDVAVPLGMIINELVSNSFKHAFPGRSEGEIQIKLHREENGEYIKSINENCMSTTFALTISDNGVGIPENLEIEELDSLGLQLVTSLVAQLDGELELRRYNGAKFTVRFTVTDKNHASAAARQLLVE
jgi:PAS domain S-box-containing protein